MEKYYDPRKDIRVQKPKVSKFRSKFIKAALYGKLCQTLDLLICIQTSTSRENSSFNPGFYK